MSGSVTPSFWEIKTREQCTFGRRPERWSINQSIYQSINQSMNQSSLSSYVVSSKARSADGRVLCREYFNWSKSPTSLIFSSVCKHKNTHTHTHRCHMQLRSCLDQLNTTSTVALTTGTVKGASERPLLLYHTRLKTTTSMTQHHRKPLK